MLDISLDALSREVYEKIRIGLDYDEVLAGVERADADLPGSQRTGAVRQRAALTKCAFGTLAKAQCRSSSMTSQPHRRSGPV
jgi:hypothetical protein